MGVTLSGSAPTLVAVGDHAHELLFQGSLGGSRRMYGDYNGSGGISFFLPSMTTAIAPNYTNPAIANSSGGHSHSVTNGSYSITGTSFIGNLATITVGTASVVAHNNEPQYLNIYYLIRVN